MSQMFPAIGLDWTSHSYSPAKVPQWPWWAFIKGCQPMAIEKSKPV